MDDTSLGQDVQISRTNVRAPNGDWFHVSTMNRETSAMLNAGHRYAETVAWRLEDGERGEMFGPLAGSWEGGVDEHNRVVARIRYTGSPDEPEDA